MLELKPNDRKKKFMHTVYDADGNYLEVTGSAWTISGNLDSDDMSSGNMITFSPSSALTNGRISATWGETISDETGLITVTGGAQAYLKIRDQSGGAGGAGGAGTAP